MTDDPRVHTQAKKRSWPLRTYLLPLILPLVLVVAGSVTLSVSVRTQVDDLALELEHETDNSLHLTQHIFSSLLALESSLHEMVYTADSTHARLSFAKAGRALSESIFDEHPSAKPLLEKLRGHIRNTWQLREQYDLERAVINRDWHTLYSTLFRLSSMMSGYNTRLVQNYTDTERVTVRHLEPIAVHFDNLQSFRPAIARICKDAHKITDAEVRKTFDEHCSMVGSMPAELEKKLLQLSQIRTHFLESVRNLETDSANLRREYSVIEKTKLFEQIRSVTSYYGKMQPLFLAFVILAVLLALTCVVGTFYLLKPLTNLTEQMRRFLSTQEMPGVKARTPVVEINEVINWMLRFCRLLLRNRRDIDSLTNRYDELLLDSHKDPLTGLANRKALEEFIARQSKLPAHATLLMIDLDFFKKVNDVNGHLVGDEMLRAVARQLRRNISRSDPIYRYGGEEFCVFLTNVTEEEAIGIAKRLVECVRCISRRDASIVEGRYADDPLTISVGIAAVNLKVGEKDFLSLLREADEALYEAKRAGRNCVRVFRRRHPHNLSTTEVAT